MALHVTLQSSVAGSLTPTVASETFHATVTHVLEVHRDALLRRQAQANDPRLCGYIDGDNGMPVKCSGAFGCEMATVNNLPLFACCDLVICQGLAVTCVDAFTNICTTQSIYCEAYDTMILSWLVRTVHFLFQNAHPCGIGPDNIIASSSPTACVTYLVAPTGTQVDLFTSWACGDAPSTTTILQKAIEGSNNANTRATATSSRESNPGNSDSDSGSSGNSPGSDDSTNSGGINDIAPSNSIANAGIIAGIVLGVIIVLLMAGWGIWRYRKRQQEKNETKQRLAGFTKEFELQEPGGPSEALMAANQTAHWLWKQGMDDRMTVVG